MKGRVAQLVEHYLDMVVAAGSSPVVATIITPILILIFFCEFLIFINSKGVLNTLLITLL